MLIFRLLIKKIHFYFPRGDYVLIVSRQPGKSSGQETWWSIDPSLCHCPTNNTRHIYSTWVFLLILITPMLGNQPRFNYSALDPKHHPGRNLRTRTIVTMYSIYLRISFRTKETLRRCLSYVGLLQARLPTIRLSTRRVEEDVPKEYSSPKHFKAVDQIPAFPRNM